MNRGVVFVGKDSNSNEYYADSKTGKRFVKYSKGEDPTTISSLWYMWLHNKSVDVVSRKFSWEIERHRNVTNDTDSFMPDSEQNKRIKNNSIYDYWKVENNDK
ncbi:NADH:ubiquinone oxidoreductase [Anaplasmataceae bacterium AB001_6]|nr:NADH:ubiquinone oxidoreductase [Anaplasmataceae bacterium AB001_6]